MLIIFGALKIELIPILRSIHINNIRKTGKTIIYEGFKNSRPITIIQTGMGAKNAIRAAEFFKDNYSEYVMNNGSRPGNNTEVLMIGFCGAADRKIKAGDTVVYSLIKNIDYSDEKGFLLNGSLGLNREKILDSLLSDGFIDVAGATVYKVVTDPIVKKKINNDFDVQAIDMESYWIGKSIRSMDLPFTCLRIVSDGAEDILTSYYGSANGIKITFNIILSFLRSIFHRKEFIANLNAFRNLRKANLRLAEVSTELLASFKTGNSDKTL